MLDNFRKEKEKMVKKIKRKPKRRRTGIKCKAGPLTQSQNYWERFPKCLKKRDTCFGLAHLPGCGRRESG